jgi:hypothetical protein
MASGFVQSAADLADGNRSGRSSNAGCAATAVDEQAQTRIASAPRASWSPKIRDWPRHRIVASPDRRRCSRPMPES